MNLLKETEHDIQNAILEYLTLRGHYCWRQNTGTMKLEYKGKERFFRAGFKGISDIIGIHRIAGCFIAIEVKRAGNVPTESQKLFLREIKSRSGIAIVAYSVDDVIKAGL